jgi:hypothetical protein
MTWVALGSRIPTQALLVMCLHYYTLTRSSPRRTGRATIPLKKASHIEVSRMLCDYYRVVGSNLSIIIRAAEILAYLKRVAGKFELEKQGVLRLRTRVVEARWSETDQCWQILMQQVSGNDPNTMPTVEREYRVRSQFLICATGKLIVPSIPTVEGLESFKGASFHTACWDHSLDLKVLKGTPMTCSHRSEIPLPEINFPAVACPTRASAWRWWAVVPVPCRWCPPLPLRWDISPSSSGPRRTSSHGTTSSSPVSGKGALVSAHRGLGP